VLLNQNRRLHLQSSIRNIGSRGSRRLGDILPAAADIQYRWLQSYLLSWTQVGTRTSFRHLQCRSMMSWCQYVTCASSLKQLFSEQNRSVSPYFTRCDGFNHRLPGTTSHCPNTCAVSTEQWQNLLVGLSAYIVHCALLSGSASSCGDLRVQPVILI